MLPVIAGAAARFAPALSRKLGTSGGVSGVLNFAKQNPTTFLLAAKETFDQGVSVFDLMMQEAPEAVAQLQQMVREQSAIVVGDPVKSDTLQQLDDLQDEMEAIDVAVRYVGGYDALQTLRRVMTFSDDHFSMYLRVRRLAQSVR